MADEKSEKSEEKPEKKEKREPRPSKKDKAESREAARPKAVSNTAAQPARFIQKYAKEVVPALTKQFGYKNPNQVPRLRKVVINMGLGQAVTNPKIIDSAVEELRSITGQKPIVTRSKKA